MQKAIIFILGRYLNFINLISKKIGGKHGKTPLSETNSLEAPWRVHTIVQHAEYRNPVIGDAEIDRVSPYRATAIPFTDIITGRAELWIVCDLIDGGDEFIGVTMSLLDPPFFERV